MLNDQMNLWANFFICVDGSVRNSNIYVCKNIEVSSYLVILAEHVNDLLVCVCASVGSILHSLWRVKFEIQTNDH